MPITAESFTVEHFEKLVRGVGVAQEAFAQREQENQDLDRACAELITERDKLADELSEERGARDELRTLVEKIDDVRRGIIDFNELLVFVKGRHA